ncbi:MAG: nucleotide-diphospho-sugar transferase [Verrucomicrobiota bacterium]
MDTALLLIHFNRPDVTRRQVDALRTIAPKRVWVLCDAPRPDRVGEDKKVDEVRSILDALPWDCEVHKLYREENLGVRENISTGLSWFLNECKEGIILEDDCIPSESFFRFVVEALERYRDDVRVFTVSGYTGLDSDLPIEESYCYSNYFSCWGWATWKRSWDCYDESMTAFTDQEKWKAICARLHPSIRQHLYWKYIFGRVVAGKVDSWAYRFLLSMWSHHGYAVTPKRNLIENIGFTDDATNTGGLKVFQTPKTEITFPLICPSEVESNKAVDQWIEDNCHSKSLKVRLAWLSQKIQQKFKAN